MGDGFKEMLQPEQGCFISQLRKEKQDYEFLTESQQPLAPAC